MKDRSFDKKKVAFVSSNAWTMYNFRREVIESLIQSGYKILIIAGYDKCADLLIAMGCEFIPATVRNRSLNPFYDVRLFLTLRNIYKTHRPDFIFHYVVKPNIYGTLAAGLLGIPSVAVITGLGHAFNKNGLLKNLIKRMYRIALKHAKSVWCLNKEDAEYFLRNKIVPATKIKILPGEGINLDYFKRVPAARNRADHFNFLMCARLLKSKGISDYAAATLVLKNKNYVFNSILIGAQEDHPDAIPLSEIDKWVTEGSLVYKGFYDDVREHLACCDCYVYPSYYNEGVPRSLLEACSMELPVITTNNPGCRELVEEGLNGFLCAMRNSNELASKMEKMLLLDEHHRRTMGKKAREIVEEKYSMSFIINNYHQLLDSI